MGGRSLCSVHIIPLSAVQRQQSRATRRQPHAIGSVVSPLEGIKGAQIAGEENKSAPPHFYAAYLVPQRSFRFVTRISSYELSYRCRIPRPIRLISHPLAARPGRVFAFLHEHDDTSLDVRTQVSHECVVVVVA